MEGKAHMAIGGALGLAVAQPVIITASLAGLASVEDKVHLAISGAIGWLAALPLTAGINWLMSVEDKTHLAVSGAIRWVAAQPSFAYAYHFNLLLIPLMSFTGFVAAGIPDVFDSRDAAGRDPVGLSWKGIKKDGKRVKSFTDGLLLLPRALVAIVIDLISKIIPHRGPTHWLLTWFGLSLLAVGAVIALHWPMPFAFAFSVGYLSHLLADTLTHSGVPLLGPMSKHRVHLLPGILRFRFDSPVQWAYVLVIWCLVLFAWRGPLASAARWIVGGLG
jgi:membrane-bound metal-dependent hydrolase YbcI (DUF457 family)